MNKIYSKLKSVKVIVVITVIVASLGFSKVVSDDYFEVMKNLEIFTSLYKELNIYYVDETKPGELMKTGINAMLKSLDPYTVYYPESKIEDYRFMTTGQYGGIGALVHKREGEFVISEIYEGFPAHKAGLIAGDVVLEIDGREISEMKQSEIGDLLKGQAGTEVDVKIRRDTENREDVLAVSREDVKIPDVPFYNMLDDETGYIKLTGFTRTASQEVRTALKDLQGKQMKQLILDLRGNGGGLLREAVNIVNLFVPKGEIIVSTRGKIEDWNKTHVALNEPIAPDLPLIVLVDRGSASASEIVSGALQDFDRAVVVGELSFGKGLVQRTKDIAYNSKLKLTIAKYYIPSGRCIQKLDYSHRESNGKVKEVPDSLLKAFETKGGRTVFDGRGVAPDVKVEQEEFSNVLGGLISNYIIFDYVTNYHHTHDSIVPPADYRFSDSEYDAFVKYALESEFEYNSYTEKLFEELKEVSKEERYFDDAETEFDLLYEKIEPQTEKDLEKFKKSIVEILENEIVSRYYYQSGRIKNTLAKDPYILSANQVFENDYSNILDGTINRN